jgi:hypothetical protein
MSVPHVPVGRCRPRHRLGAQALCVARPDNAPHAVATDLVHLPKSGYEIRRPISRGTLVRTIDRRKGNVPLFSFKDPLLTSYMAAERPRSGGFEDAKSLIVGGRQSRQRLYLSAQP